MDTNLFEPIKLHTGKTRSPTEAHTESSKSDTSRDAFYSSPTLNDIGKPGFKKHIPEGKISLICGIIKDMPDVGVRAPYSGDGSTVSNNI